MKKEKKESGYILKLSEKLSCGACGVCVASAVGWLFYDSCYVIPFLVVPAIMLCAAAYGNYRYEQQRSRLLGEFKDAMQAVSAALLAGYSMENSWREAEREILKQHGGESLMYRELRRINAAVGMSRTIEQMFAEFAYRSGCEDIESFAEVFSFAKRSGGNYVEIIRTTVQKLSDRIDVERAIDTELAGKKLEGRVMDMMPILILAYMKVTSREFMSALYGNAAGVIVMSAALVAYLGAIRLSERILNIRM